MNCSIQVVAEKILEDITTIASFALLILSCLLCSLKSFAESKNAV